MTPTEFKANVSNKGEISEAFDVINDVCCPTHSFPPSIQALLEEAVRGTNDSVFIKSRQDVDLFSDKQTPKNKGLPLYWMESAVRWQRTTRPQEIQQQKKIKRSA